MLLRTRYQVTGSVQISTDNHDDFFIILLSGVQTLDLPVCPHLFTYPQPLPLEAEVILPS